MRAKSAKNFEDMLKELENLVKELESGTLPLESSLEIFERGINLTRLCQAKLAEAEKKVEILVGERVVPFEGNQAEETREA
jgi:exodeoxyribonuclease VII small subunit